MAASQSLSILATTTINSSNPSIHLHSTKSSSSSSSSLSLFPLNSFLGEQISLKFTNSSNPVTTHRNNFTAFATVSFSLPTSKIPDKVSTEKSPKWSARAIKSFAMGELEARKLKYSTTGTEALLMGILVEGTSLAAKFLRANGVSLFKVRDEAVDLLGKSDMYFFSPEHPPLTEPAQRALDYAVDEKLKSGDSGEITTTHLLLGIWNERESAGHKIMAKFGFDDEKAAELAKSKDEDYVRNYR